jgi:TonB family protein
MMKAQIFAFLVALACIAPAAAQQALPEEIASPYVIYSQALDAEDYETARRAAREAWDAAERLGYDTVTTATLADNYAHIASALSDHGEAYRGYLRAGELRESAGGEASLIIESWILAANAALVAGEHDDANRVADLAGDLANNADALEGAERANLAFTARSIQATALWRAGRLRPSASRAQQAIDAAEGHDFSEQPYYALLTFVLGATHALNKENEDAAYWLTVAYHYMPSQRRGLGYWSRYIRSQLDARERVALLDRLARTALPPLGAEAPEEDPIQALRDREGFVDATPASRNAPSYPSAAARTGFEGLAVVQFTVREDGRVVDPEVLFSIPATDFGDAALRAVRRWRYEPATVDGEPVERPGVTTQFEFILRG